MGREASLHHLAPVHAPWQKYPPSKMSTVLVPAAVSALLNQTGSGDVLWLCGSERHTALPAVWHKALAVPRAPWDAPTGLDINVVSWLCRCCIRHWTVRVCSPPRRNPSQALRVGTCGHWREHPGRPQDRAGQTWCTLPDRPSWVHGPAASQHPSRERSRQISSVYWGVG